MVPTHTLIVIATVIFLHFQHQATGSYVPACPSIVKKDCSQDDMATSKYEHLTTYKYDYHHLRTQMEANTVS